MPPDGFTDSGPGGYNARMSRVIHFEDDLFVVDGLVRVIGDAARLEPDADVVGEAVLSSIRLADSMLRRIMALVVQNAHLVDRPEYLRLLSRTTAALSESIRMMTRNEGLMASGAAASRDELERVAQAQKAASEELLDALRESTVQSVSLEDLVSGDELSELLRT